MAITELTRIDKSIRIGNTNLPSLGCGATIIDDLLTHTGDWVAIMSYDSANVVLDYKVTTYGDATVVDWENFTADMNLKAASVAGNFQPIYGNFTSIRLTGGKILAYNRCR